MAASSTTVQNATSHLEKLRHHLEDDLFADLKYAFLAKGCGARKKIKGLTFNHKLMLQMCLLRDEAGKTWSDKEMFLQKLCGEVPPHRIKTVIEKTLLEADHWDLHTDGTSRSGKKYVSQQLTVDGQSLSTGYVIVATEDTTTLVDISMKLLEELSLLHGEEESHETFLQMLHQLSGLMSDRCNTMKSFDKAFQEES
ncbi:hypothetical protein LSH36_1525g00036 [Paralvinella palmiformis]|uniref:Uncharacterized protein n=1 Tax=Paralvinella palmiformis TaxID=53620 RepID=A0AAD9ITH2_9ANNE|nr:hypothetical protein LSH36_1525g00036 [Paralvinella palmiformis]